MLDPRSPGTLCATVLDPTFIHNDVHVYMYKIVVRGLTSEAKFPRCDLHQRHRKPQIIRYLVNTTTY
jgi:hypothetical protein